MSGTFLYRLEKARIESLVQQLNELAKQGFDWESIEDLGKRLEFCRKELTKGKVNNVANELNSVDDEIIALSLLGKDFRYSVNTREPDFIGSQRSIELWSPQTIGIYTKVLKHVYVIADETLKRPGFLLQVVYDPYRREYVKYDMYEIPRGAVRAAAEIVVDISGIQHQVAQAIIQGVTKKAKRKFKDRRGSVMVSLRHVSIADPASIAAMLRETLQKHGSRYPYNRLDGILLLIQYLDMDSLSLTPALYVIPNPHSPNPLSPKEFAGPIALPPKVNVVFAMPVHIHFEKPNQLYDALVLEDGYLVINDRKVAQTIAFGNPRTIGAFTGLLGAPRNVSQLVASIRNRIYIIP